ncbi:molybdenum cofactor guanylyltransferase MobA [Methylobrevis albus]|uniref:Molybdenum cofactor guanylyltransferase n=1 Tax=Methylobrevis albus TaxID=2793297 RepID=A0A931I0E0_9HYPH|nr:molybdenum cofactor guanylyltransferase MobA [Methylobrevis albus]MBH0237035.1 molybdenum cofactor guanylyltransferase MobA [Methylobrevis albus]
MLTVAAPAAPVAGCILAGGRSQRMGGGDKALLPLGGRPLVAHVADRLAPQVGALVLNANGDPARFAFLGLAVVADGVPDHPGPLAGILAGLDHAAGLSDRPRALVTVAADTPFLPADFVARLVAASEGYARAVLARSATGVHPVCALWPLGCAAALRAFLGGGRRKVLAFADEVGAAEAAFPEGRIGAEPVDPFFNINRPEDLAAAERFATSREAAS